LPAKSVQPTFADGPALNDWSPVAGAAALVIPGMSEQAATRPMQPARKRARPPRRQRGVS
jgi:hypothetical protein